jgi:protein Mpv17
MLQGKSADYVVEEMPRILPEMVINNWKLWIPAQSINLGFVASKYQVLVSNVVAVAWNTYLSITTQPSNASDTISFLKEEAVEC